MFSETKKISRARNLESKSLAGGVNRDTDPDTTPQCLCALALSKFLAELGTPRKKFLVKRILMSKADVSIAFRNVREDPDDANNFCYTVVIVQEYESTLLFVSKIWTFIGVKRCSLFYSLFCSLFCSLFSSLFCPLFCPLFCSLFCSPWLSFDFF